MCLSVAGAAHRGKIDPFQAIAEDIPEKAAHLTWLDDEAQSVGLMLQFLLLYTFTLDPAALRAFAMVLEHLASSSCWRTSSTIMFYCSVVDAFCQSGIPWPNPPLPCWMWPTT